ncbi:GH-E family nuclease [Zoogloea sp. 1C4]|uniref:GH-E family nuclease n=1 Tax=Zoogloea sp. 1C4 TaxID=2570190 RepID=UPI001D172777|nr:GH-E family nuclease [Zoogloea sp. 1C4]
MSGKGKVKPNNQAAPGPIGNTQGLIVPQTQPNASGPGNSAPPPKPTPKEEGWWNRWGSDALHTTLDVVGLIPGVGEVADGANALVYLAEGDKVSAALSAAAMLPIGGQAATAAKMAKKGAQALEKQATKKAAEEAVEHSVKEAAEKAAKEKLEREAAEKAKKEAQAAASGGRVEKISPRDDPRYRRGKFRKGKREKVWEDAKDSDGKVRDPKTGREMKENEPWDMGHKPGYEHRKHQESASRRDIDRKKFLDEYNDTTKYRPELPSSNRSHAGEIRTNDYFGD